MINRLHSEGAFKNLHSKAIPALYSAYAGNIGMKDVEEIQRLKETLLKEYLLPRVKEEKRHELINLIHILQLEYKDF